MSAARILLNLSVKVRYSVISHIASEVSVKALLEYYHQFIGTVRAREKRYSLEDIVALTR